MINAEGRLENATVTRRRFFSWGIGGIVAAMAAMLAVPVAKYLAYPALETQGSIGTPVAGLDEIKRGQPSLFKVSIEKRSGWVKTTKAASLYIETLDGKSFTALSNICTHLGCPVRWDSGRQVFLCPCHNGVFDRSGNVISGPAPGRSTATRRRSRVTSSSSWPDNGLALTPPLVPRRAVS